MQLHIQRGTESLGIFSLEETTQYLTEGSLLESDLAWHEGLEEWMPLGQVCTQLTTQPNAPEPAAVETTSEVPASFGQGRYRCQQLLGQGGMGQVWLAYDEQLERPVALKVLHQRSAADIEALKGLKEEVQKCLELTHPNIIRIYDLAEPPGEDAFISMEYVSGEDLYVKLKQHPEGRFSWKEIEPYALSLCNGLEYAHDQGMVHRDLKPQNLMVTQENELKLADFGIAAPATEDGDEAVPRAGTPVYWGPQQAQGMTPAPTDDIYSLGITLYNLLVGQAPFLGANEPEITRHHIEDEPMRPQKKLEALGGKGKIPGYVSDLILKCLAKKPTERFRGAGEVRAWIKAKGDPVVKRQKRMALVSGVMGVVALAMGALAVWAWAQRTEAVKQKGIAETKQQQAEEAQKAEAEQRMKAVKAKDDEAKQRKEAEAQRGRAETELKKAKEVTAWAVDIFRGIKQGELDNATKEQKLLLEKALKQSAERIRDLKDKPKVEAKIRLILGEAYHAINEDKKALEHHERALALFLKSPDPNDEGEVVRCYTNIGVVRNKMAEYDRALECFQKALAIQLKHLGPDHPHVAISYTNIGAVYSAKGESDQALEYQKKAMAIGPKQNGPENPVLVASKYNNLAAVHLEKREYDQALELMKKSAAIFHKHLGPNHPNVAICYNNIGAVYDHKSEPDKALEYYHKALKIDLKQLGPDHTGVAFRYRNIGMVHFNKGEYPQALEYQEKALAIRLKRRGPDHPDTVESRASVKLTKSMIDSNPKPVPEKK